MKFFNKYVFVFLVGAVVFSAIYLSIGSNDSEKVFQERPLVSSMTVTPSVPESVTFCGETIMLHDYNMREGLDRELTSFTYFHSTTLLLFKRANRYFPIIEPILKKNGIPDDFKYLALIESHLDPNVVSPARAAGLWQFMEGTAKDFGLTVNAIVDERRDVKKATEAACRYLKTGYSRYGEWTNVAASYNAGFGRISGELEKQNEKSIFDLWLVEETSRYVFRILAIKQIFENPYKYGFIIRPQDLYKPLSVREVKVSADIQDLAEFAHAQGITYADLKRFNTWLRDRKLTTAGKEYTLDIVNKKDLSYDKPNTYLHDSRWMVK